MASARNSSHNSAMCVFTGSNLGALPEYRSAAEELGAKLVERSLGLVYGGGRVGLMGAVADAVLDAGGRATGVIPGALMGKEIAHEGLTDLEIVGSMHERKHRMAELADGFIAMPGGMGTLEELSEVVTWAQLGIHSKPCGVLNVVGYFDHLIAYIDHAVANEFVRKEHRSILQVASAPDELLDLMAAYKAVHVGKWLELEQA